VRQRGEDPTNVNIMATELGISLVEFRSWKDQIVPVTGRSLDEIYDDHSVWFADEGPNPETALLDDELRQKLVENLKKLGEREALVLQLYYVEDLNLEEISEVLSVTVGRISQIKKAAITQLRRTMLESE
jgi:RNA polymerase sigma factor for flagellar operon FliA